VTGKLWLFEMAPLQSKGWTFAAGLLIWWLFPANAGPCHEGLGSRQDSGLETPAEQTILALNQIVTFDLAHHQLSEFIRLIRDQSGVQLVLDRQGLSKAGINSDDVVVSTKLNGTLLSVLNQIRSQYNLGYAIIGEMVLITSEELAVDRQMRQRVSVRYDRLQLRAALDQLARDTATNIVLDRLAVSNGSLPVSIKVDHAPLEVVVRLLAHQVGLKQMRVGNVMMVTTRENAAELRNSSEIELSHLQPIPGPVFLADVDR
jgi:hypothetical protein